MFIFFISLLLSCPWDLMTPWCWGSFATQACWRLCTSNNQATASNIPFRYLYTNTLRAHETFSDPPLEAGMDFSSFVEGFRSFPVFGHNRGIQGWTHEFTLSSLSSSVPRCGQWAWVCINGGIVLHHVPEGQKCVVVFFYSGCFFLKGNFKTIELTIN